MSRASAADTLVSTSSLWRVTKIVVMSLLMIQGLILHSAHAFEYSSEKRVASFYDSQGNRWEVLTDVIWAGFEETPDSASALIFFKNGVPTAAGDRQLQAFVDYIGSAVSVQNVYPFGLLQDDVYEEDGYWRPNCVSAASLACGAAATGFGFSDRRTVYKKLLKDAVLSTNLTGLMSESYVRLHDGTEIYSSALTDRIERTIESGLKARGMYEEGKDNLETLTRLYTLDPDYQLPVPDGVQALSDALNVIEGWKAHYDEVVGAHQYVVLREYLAKADFVHRRLDVIDWFLDVASQTTTVDPALTAAAVEVREDLLGQVASFREKLLESYLELGEGKLVDRLQSIASNSKFYIMMLDGLRGKFKLAASASNFLKKMDAGALNNGIKGIKEAYKTYDVSTDKWRNVFLSYSLNALLNSVDSEVKDRLYRGDIVNLNNDSVLTYNPQALGRLEAYSDVSSSIIKSYYDYILILIDSDWAATINQVVEGTLDTLSAPQYYALHYSAAAISFGSNTGAGLSSFIYNDEVRWAKEDVEGIVERAIKRREVLAKWSYLISSYEDSDGDGYTDFFEPFPEIENSEPQASLTLGSSNVTVGDTVSADASGSSAPYGGPLDFDWLLGKPGDSHASFKISGDKASFEPDIAGTYEVKIVVSDGNTKSSDSQTRILLVESGQIPVGTINLPNEYVLGTGNTGASGSEGWSHGLSASGGWCVNVGQDKSNGCFNGGPWVEDIVFWLFGHEGDEPIGLAAQEGAPPEMKTIITTGGTEITHFDNYDWLGEDTSRGELVDITLPAPGTYYFAAYAFGDFANSSIWFEVDVSDDIDNDGVENTLDDYPRDSARKYDSDGDGFADRDDAFPVDPAASIDSDGDGYPNEWNVGRSAGDSTTGLVLDHPDFANNGSEWADSDSDGVGDNEDRFDSDRAASLDSDNDGAPDKWNSGYNAGDSATGLHLDQFPHDSAASKDEDGDGYPGSWNPGKSQTDSISGLILDQYPNDGTEWVDTDLDGVGDNSDWAPNDGTEWADSDGDGVGDNGDVAPHDETRAINTAPVVSKIDSQILEPGDSLSIPISITDADDDTPVISLLNPPSFITQTGLTISLNPPSDLNGEFIVTLRVEDGFGGVTFESFNLAVGDVEAPIVSAPAGITIGASGPDGVSVEDSQLADFLGGASANDNQDGLISDIGHDAPDALPIGETVVTFRAVDDAGNEGFASSKVTVADLEAPEISIPGTLRIELESGSHAFPLDTDIQYWLADITATDNVDGNVAVSHDAPSGFPVGETTVTATAQDSAGNVATKSGLVTVTSLDWDADGMPNTFEQDNGLDPNNPSDAELDPDMDGKSNIEEYHEGLDIHKDDVPPELTIPPDVLKAASGPKTEVLLGDASAYDRKDGVIMPLPDDAGPYPPGPNKVVWSASDAAGNTTTATQMVNIQPIASFGVDKTIEEGQAARIEVSLNGEAVKYPVRIPFTISGSARAGEDYQLNTGEVLIDSGWKGWVNIPTVNDGLEEVPETIVVSMGVPHNAVRGTNQSSTFTLKEKNLKPSLSLKITQGGVDSPIVYADQGTVEVRVSVSDPNSNDSHTVEWLFDGEIVKVSPDKVLDLDISKHEVGFYRLSAVATDDGVGQLTDSLQTILEIVGEKPELSEGKDSDNDGFADIEEGLADSNANRIPDYLDPLESETRLFAGKENMELQAEAGMKLVLGEAAFLTTGNARLEAEQLREGFLFDSHWNVEDSEYLYLSGVFDFEVNNLGDEEVARVVIPQDAAIPAGAVYRKFSESRGWSDFDTSGPNTVSSAPGRPTSCPEPGSDRYQPGLIEGYYCIQLSIEDGGPNDQDETRNGRIQDLGGVAARIPDEVNISFTKQELDNKELDTKAGDQVVLRFTAKANSTDAELYRLTMMLEGSLEPKSGFRLWADTHDSEVDQWTIQDQSAVGKYNAEEESVTFSFEPPLRLNTDELHLWVTHSPHGSEDAQ